MQQYTPNNTLDGLLRGRDYYSQERTKLTIRLVRDVSCCTQATAEQRRQEAEEKQRERDRQAAEKEGRAKKRRKQHALLSKRTRGGQPVMKHTMQYLLEKIQSER